MTRGIGVPSEQHRAFFVVAQQQYRGLVEADESSSVALIRALQDALNGRALFAHITLTR